MDILTKEKTNDTSDESHKTDSPDPSSRGTLNTIAEQLSEADEGGHPSADSTLKNSEEDLSGTTASTADSTSKSIISLIPSNRDAENVRETIQPQQEDKAQTTMMDQPLDMTVPPLSASSCQVVPQTKSPASISISEPSSQEISNQNNEKMADKPLIVPQDTPIMAEPPTKPKPVSIFASLFPTPASRPSDTPKSRTPTPPNQTAKNPSLPPINSAPYSTPIAKEGSNHPITQKQLKSEAITDIQMPFPADQTASDESPIPGLKVENSGATGEVMTKASPSPQQSAPESNAGEGIDLMELDAIRDTEDNKPPKSSNDGVNVDAKIESGTSPVGAKIAIKYPIAGKTMKSRKSSTTPPTIPGVESRKVQRTKSSSVSPGCRSKKKPLPPREDGQDGRNDFYCWMCHKEGEVLCCELCPRVFHAKCLNMVQEPEGDWFCPECGKITEAECKETQSRAMSMLTIDQFSLLLKYVIQRMKIPLSEPFHDPVDTKMFLDYLDYVFHPMDLSTIERNVKKRKYGCPEAFLCDFKWVIHNCVIYNSPHSKLTQTAKAMLKVAERELNEIEVCPECYLNSCRKRENWFCEPCKELHPLVWAKLQGFPHWPAKALRIEKGMVDVRFFGQHDRAWIPVSGCYLISKELPLPIKNKKKSKGPGLRGGLDGAMQEMQVYIENIKKITGEFEYAPSRTLLTHCDLYRKTSSMKATQSVKQQGESDGKSAGTSGKSDTADIKAKIELRDVAAGKELIKSKGVGSTTPKKAKTVTTSGEHPARSFATKKKKASMEFLNKTIESCKASLGIEKIQDVKMNSGSDETTSSSEDEENEEEEEKEEAKDVQNIGQDVPTTSTLKSNPEEDDSDSELVIDLGDMEESTDAKVKEHSPPVPNQIAEKPMEVGSPKTEDVLVKKRKVDEPSVPKPPLKSILLNTSKPPDKVERKKMLAKALSEKIATGKRKHDVEGSPSAASPVTKSRKTHEPHEKRGNSPTELAKILEKSGSKDKDWKKSHHTGKYLEKEISGKIKTGIVKSSTSEKKVSDPLKHKHKEMRDVSQKLTIKKTLPLDKSGKTVKIPTEADTRKLFNGGRIPRKNTVTNISDEEPEHKEQDDAPAMETNQIPETRRKNMEQSQSNPRSAATRQVNLMSQISSEPQRKTTDENVTSANLKKYSDKVMDTVQKVFYEMYTDMMVPLRANAGADQASAATATSMHELAQMRLELERLKWMHEQEIAEVKHNHDLTIAEIRQSLEYEKKQLVLEAKVQAEAVKNRAIEETKRKQWCAHCNKEAIFYCCWNTSYCDYPCQQKHWPQHMKSCTQAKESAASAQSIAAETKLSPPVQHSAVPQTPPRVTAVVSTQPSKSIVTSSTPPGKTTFTISASPGNISRLTSTGKQTIILPTSIQAPHSIVTSKEKTHSIATAKEKTQLKTATVITADLKLQKPPSVATTQQQQKSGSAISAIGARLLAAKQRSTVKVPFVTSSGKATELKNITVTSSATQPSETSLTFTEHVKTTMESPLSPDTKPPSPKKNIFSVSTLINSDEDPIKDAKQQPEVTNELTVPKKIDLDPHPPSDHNIPPKPQSPSTVTKPKNPSAPLISKPSKPGEPLKEKIVSKPTVPVSKAVFSSPSAVASLIADMGTPLSSTISSPESSSFSDTPDKKTDTPKIRLSLSGSAFTKVVPDTAKAISVPVRDTGATIDKPLLPPTTTSKPNLNPVSTFKPIDREPMEDVSTTVAEAKEPGIVPVIAPVLADSYLTSLQKTLVPKTDTPASPEGVMEEDQPVSKTELPRPVLPESDEDKQPKTIARLSDSDIGEPMDTDNIG